MDPQHINLGEKVTNADCLEGVERHPPPEVTQKGACCQEDPSGNVWELQVPLVAQDKAGGSSSSSSHESIQIMTQMSPRSVQRNVWLISFVFMLLFTAFWGLAQLQSSLHVTQGMGVITQSILYATMTISSLFIPKPIIFKVGHKWTLAVSMMGYILWIAANGYAVWGTMVLANIILGLCAPPLWTSQCSYFTIAGTHYSKMTGEAQEAVLGKFFGIFFMMFQMNKMIGSVISSVVLNQRPDNYTDPSGEDAWTYCGARDCPQSNISNTNYSMQDPILVWTLVGVYAAIAVSALIIHILFVDQLPEEWVDKPQGSVAKETCRSVGAAVRLMVNWKMWMLVPLSMYNGLEQLLIMSEYNKSFVTCAIGIWMVGFIQIPGAAVNSVTSFSCGRILKYTGRIPLFSVALMMDLIMLLSALLWLPDPSQLTIFFVIPILSGVADGIWQAQINSLYGVLFPNDSEAAFSNYRLWQSLGFALAFAYSNFICFDKKIYINLAFLMISMTLYYVLEIVLCYGKDKVDVKQVDNEMQEKEQVHLLREEDDATKIHTHQEGGINIELQEKMQSTDAANMDIYTT